MNLRHVLGVLCCLEEARVPHTPFFIGKAMLPHTPVVHLYPDVPIASLTLRQLLDQLECLQLHWGPVLSGLMMTAEKDAGAANRPDLLLRALMARLGEIAGYSKPRDNGELL
jgi:hypothetical protein